MTNGLQPYGRQSAPLTGGARFIRGFKRIGLAVGGLILLTGLGTSFFIAIDAQRNAENRYGQASCVVGKIQRNEPLKTLTYDASSVDLISSGCMGSRFSMSINDARTYGTQMPAPMEMMIEPIYFGALLSVGGATLAFAFFWLVGWLCAGFTKD
ncbi:hypothetical protein [Bradyrhizobium septentrionale]|uniref:Uncharacterized protein n=1 Tax=Bradyrhizobium septentrionale TaxID=1404411 RepID=A0A974A190_9BRAD|nr:hypothetical protein [Bradyrhizobium septentrionale]UGY13204.1 hypothetical protein HAP48_0032045 [Bradyrhizobium septentrionale]UGY21824.1 hypothetical protein HU675_0027865 [Bradyrhizobium septentrionale]